MPASISLSSWLDQLGFVDALWIGSAAFAALTLVSIASGYAIERLFRAYRIYDVPLRPGQLRHELLGNLLMLQDTNVASWFAPYQRNAALWSLSYEWAFYLMFFATHLALRERPHAQKWAVVGLSLVGFASYFVVGNQISLFLMYFPIWWCGVEIARELLDSGDVTLRRQLVGLANVGLIAGLWLIPVYQAWSSGTPLVMWKHPVIEFRHFATALLILVAGIAWHRMKWVGFYPLLGVFERIAPISYGLYIVHYPIVHLASQVQGWGTPWLPFVIVLPSVLGLAWLAFAAASPWWSAAWTLRWLAASEGALQAALLVSLHALALQHAGPSFAITRFVTMMAALNLPRVLGPMLAPALAEHGWVAVFAGCGAASLLAAGGLALLARAAPGVRDPRGIH